MSNKNRFSPILILLCASLLLFIPAGVHAMSLAQAADVTLTVHNQSEQTICDVRIAATTDTEWGENRLVEEVIEPHASYSFPLEPGAYDVRLIDCDDVELLDRRSLEVRSDDELTLTASDVKGAECEATILQAMQYSQEYRYEEAIEALKASLICGREMDDRSEEGIILNFIGAIYMVQANYVEALEFYEQALAIVRERDDRAGEGMTLNLIGDVYQRQGRYAEALEVYALVLEIRRALRDRSGEGTALNNIGQVYYRQGRYAEALESYEEALAILREVIDRAGEGTTLSNIGLVYHAQGQNVEALEMYELALAIAQEVDSRSHQGSSYAYIGSVHYEQGRYAEALDAYELALSISREVIDRAGEGTTLANIGTVYHAQGRYADALGFFEQALAIQHEVGDRDGEGTTLANIGAVYTALEQYSDALATYENAMAMLDELRATAGSERARAAFIDQYIYVYDRVIPIYLRQGQPEEAFLTSERGRARSLLDSLATGQVELFDNAASELLAREQQTYAERQATQDALARAKALEPPAPVLVTKLEAQLAVAEAAHAETLAAIQARQDQLADLVPGRNDNVLGLESVQEELDAQTTLVSYWMLDDQTVAFVVTHDEFTVVDLPDATRDNIATAVDDIRQWRNRENAHPRPLRNLHAWLVDPLLEHLHIEQLAIVPHQLLHYVPFAALTDGERYFGQRYTLTQLPSASVLPFLNENAEQTQIMTDSAAVVVGDPQTDLPSLPYAESEAVAVADLLDTNVYTGVQASELQMRSVVSGAHVLHLAAHGSYNAANALYSAIALAPAGDEDGLLETHEIFGLPLHGNDLVALSACETNVGELSLGDEVVGLTRAFFFAGAPTVISSLWSVSDDATGALMTSFYRHWLDEGTSKAAALQAAQADVRTNPNWASPFYWAGFVLNGHPGSHSGL